MALWKNLVDKIQDTFSSSEDSGLFIGNVVIGVSDKDEKKKIASVLKSLGYKAIYAENSNELVKRAIDLNPQLVLLDSEFVGTLNCIEAAKAIKDKVAVPIIAMLSTEAVHQLKGKQLTGVESMILKPINKTALENMIQTYARPM